jgi:outer membrane protein OmpA-like peptidoglycan-associated protein
MPKGDYLLKSIKGKPLVSFIRYGKGGVVFLRPFEFQDKRYDGELLRWRLVFFLMNKMYLRDDAYQSVKDRFDKNDTITLHNLHFAYNSYELLPKSLKFLRPIAQYLKSHANTNIIVVGNTDSIASRKYNNRLSTNRANTVKMELIKMGVDANRISTKGYGEDRPVATNKTTRGRALNRRVDFIIKRK